MTDNSQQMKLYEAREGFPLSSEQLNDMFDAALFDLITILSQQRATLSSDLKDIFILMAETESRALKEFGKDLDFVKQDHTENWRTI